MTDKPQEADQGTLLAALKHPLRIIILNALNEEAMSPTQFVDRGYAPTEFSNLRRPAAVSKATYHFGGLVDVGCLQLIESIPRRGATEHIYRGTGKLRFLEKHFDQLPFEERKKLSASGFLAVAARTDRAIRLGSFDRRTNRHLTWQAGEVDLKGFEELIKILDQASAAAERICEEANIRLRQRESSDEDGIPVTFSLLGYQSPKLKD